MGISGLKMAANLLKGPFALGTIALLHLSASYAQEATGLIREDGWQSVQENCTRCHTTQMITQNSGSREVWKSRIVWMQATQGLEQLNANVEASILDYLATNYGPRAVSRRAGLGEHLLPDIPSSSAK
ncbi:MAG: hypothetical protein HQ498_15065 [Pseudohongiella sp.]|nr:hypothetical protein [Pseudohongiella sp.]